MASLCITTEVASFCRKLPRYILILLNNLSSFVARSRFRHQAGTSLMDDLQYIFDDGGKLLLQLLRNVT